MYILSFSSEGDLKLGLTRQKCEAEMVYFMNPAVFVLVALSRLKQKKEVHRVGDH